MHEVLFMIFSLITVQEYWFDSMILFLISQELLLDFVSYAHKTS